MDWIISNKCIGMESSTEEIKLDIEELKKILETATRDRTKMVLLKEIGELDKRLKIVLL